jgi:hypothetical protein
LAVDFIAATAALRAKVFSIEYNPKFRESVEKFKVSELAATV